MSGGLKLRTQLLLVVAFVQLYAIGVGLAYWIQTRAQERLEYAFEQDLAVLTKLPRLRDRLRELDGAPGRYLLVGGPERLKRRQSALTDMRFELAALEPLMEAPQASARFARLDREMSSYVAQQEQWVSLRHLVSARGPFPGRSGRRPAFSGCC